MSRQRLGALLEADAGTLREQLCYVRLDHLHDAEHALLLLGPGADGYRVHVLSERENRERLADLWDDEADRVWELGRSYRSLPRLKPSPGVRAAHSRDAGSTPPAPAPAVANPQTVAESLAASNAALVDKLKGFFELGNVGECPKDWKPTTEVVHWPAIEPSGQLRQVPYIVLAHTCAAGKYSVVKTVIPVNDPLAPKDSTRITICSTKIEQRIERRVVMEQSTKVSQIGFGFSLGFNPVFPPGLPALTSPKLGDPVHQGGKEAKDPATGQTLSFNLNFMQVHSKLRFEAWQSFFLKAGELDCHQV